MLQLLTRARFNTENNAFGQQNGLFKCKVKLCKICSLYMVESHSFIMSNNMRWELLSRVNNERFELDFKVINHPEFVLQKKNFSNNGGLFWTCLLKLKMINFPSSFMIRDGFLFSIVRMSIFHLKCFDLHMNLKNSKDKSFQTYFLNNSKKLITRMWMCKQSGRIKTFYHALAKDLRWHF